jgi:nitrite reductase (NADH) large subunit
MPRVFSSPARIVVIGNGMAATRLLEELVKLAPDRFAITVFGAEPYPGYNRILLSPVLAGEQTPEKIITHPYEWYAAHGITLRTGVRVTRIDRARREVHADDGSVVGYDRLVLATGSRPIILPLPGATAAGVVAFRDFADVDAMLARARAGAPAVVIGGGLLGLEAANGLTARGMQVTVVHLMSWLMEKQLDEKAARLLEKHLEKRGIRFLLGKETQALETENGEIRAVRLKSGEVLPATLVVMAVGIRPDTELAQAAGLAVERGVRVHDTMQTLTDPRIYAVGECVNHRGVTYGLVAPIFEQAKVCANHLAEWGIARYGGSATATRLKVTGIDLFSAGRFLPEAGDETLLFEDAGRGVYKKLVVRDNRLVGACLYGETVDGAWYFDLLREGTDISTLRETLLFGRHRVGDAGTDPKARVAALPDSAEICGCNGVCKGEIVRAIRDKQLYTLEEVRAHTKASSSCGSCTGLVEALLAQTLGGEYAAQPSKKPLCPCTEASHDEVRQAIIEQKLKSIPAVMQALGWKTEDGCAKCRPALNYYLLAAWPGEYQDDPQSRFINERAHGNIQKDGTFSVVPRLWGGLVTPRELRAIADVAEKYRVPEMKITGGQRIDLFGIRKEDLPAVWRDLAAAGFVSGYAYGKALRTVKTCVGSRWCRFGTQDSTGLGVKLEKLTWGSWMPHKFKMAVSGCPRNCAEATIKDFGVVCVESGYELHVGGNGGIKVRVTDLLTKVATEAEVLEHCAAFIQLYREEAHYLERTAPWVERVGLNYIQERVVHDAASRRALAERFQASQQHAQRDPWAERAQGSEAHEFQPLAHLE